jgi:hypothetical protein
MRCTPVRYTPYEVHGREVHIHKLHVCEMHVYEIHLHEMHACEVHPHEMHAHEMTPIRYTPMRHPPTIALVASLAQTVIDLSRSEFQNTSFCTSCGVVPIARRTGALIWYSCSTVSVLLSQPLAEVAFRASTY